MGSGVEGKGRGKKLKIVSITLNKVCLEDGWIYDSRVQRRGWD
jgi:hypothetical protein